MTFRQIQPVLTATPCIILQKHAGRKPLPEGGRAYPVGIARVPARKDQGESAGREGVFGPQNRIRRRGNQVEADARDHHVAPFFDQDAAKLAPAAARLPCARPLIGLGHFMRTRPAGPRAALSACAMSPPTAGAAAVWVNGGTAGRRNAA